MRERRARVRKLKNSSEYKNITYEGLPRYLERDSAKEKRMIKRYRCGNKFKKKLNRAVASKLFSAEFRSSVKVRK